MTLDFAMLDQMEKQGNPAGENSPARNVGLMYLGRLKKDGKIPHVGDTELKVFEQWLEAKDPNAKAAFLAAMNLAKFYVKGKLPI